MSDNPPPRPCRDTAENLLFGLLALQNNFISLDVMVATFGAWIAQKSKPIDQILLDQGHLDADCNGLPVGLARQHLKLHGDDPERSRADVSATGSVVRQLLGIGDPELSASLEHVVSTHRGDQDFDTDATGTFLGAPTATAGRFQVLRLHAEGGLGHLVPLHGRDDCRRLVLSLLDRALPANPFAPAR